MMSRGIRLRTGAIVVFQIAGIFWSACQAQPVATNLDILRTMMGETAAEVKNRLPLSGKEAVAITVLPADIGWALDELAIRVLSPPPAPAGDSAVVRAVFGVRDVHITYDDAERSGLFGEKTVERTVRMTVAVRVTRDDAVLFAGDLPREKTDRIAVSAIPAVEHPTLAIARGTLEPEGVFQDLTEPMILIGAIGVSVFLLFHVRS